MKITLETDNRSDITKALEAALKIVESAADMYPGESLTKRLRITKLDKFEISYEVEVGTMTLSA
jgi:hypothetical protein